MTKLEGIIRSGWFSYGYILYAEIDKLQGFVRENKENAT
jgi:hypothetical protein